MTQNFRQQLFFNLNNLSDSIQLNKVQTLIKIEFSLRKSEKRNDTEQIHIKNQ